MPNYKIFNFQQNKWLYRYLKKYILNNKNVKSLNDVKDISITLVEVAFRKKGFLTRKEEDWVRCAQQDVCVTPCRNSNGFKNEIDKKMKKNKCVPKTRKVDPNIKPVNGFRFHDDIQYAYEFLRNYNSIIYTLQHYKLKKKNDNVIKRIPRKKTLFKRTIADITSAYEKLIDEKIRKSTTKKNNSFISIGTSNRRTRKKRNASNFNDSSFDSEYSY